MSPRVIAVSSLALALALASCRPPSNTVNLSSESAWRESIEAWKQQRLASIAGPDGWITLVARGWIQPGANRLGSLEGSELRLPKDRAPEHAATIYLEGDALRIEVKDGVDLKVDGKAQQKAALVDDRDGKETRLTLGTLTMYVIKRGDRYALRAKDSAHPARASFPGLQYYELDPKMRVIAKLRPAPAGKTIPIANVLGQTEQMDSPGTLRFLLEGASYDLDAVREKGEDELFILFKDDTAGNGTYPSGRFLYTALPKQDGTVELDFNKAYTPPCGFTPFATCPIPPKQNHIHRPIAAGERYTFKEPPKLPLP